MLIIFFDIKGIVRKELILVDQTVNSAYNPPLADRSPF
jgi:hypothetical protein